MTQDENIQQLRERNKQLREELAKKELELLKLKEEINTTKNTGIALISPFLNALGWSFVIATILFLFFVIYFSISPCN